MTFVGFSRYQSKDGNKKGAWITCVHPYNVQNDNQFGSQHKQFWVKYDFPIDYDLLGKRVRFIFECDMNGVPQIVGMYAEPNDKK